MLRRLADEPDTLTQVTRTALDILHFDPDTATDLRPSDALLPSPDKSGEGSGVRCACACYDCLLSYSNQRDHSLLDRHPVRDFLRTLAQTVTRAGGDRRNYEAQHRYLRALTDTRSDLERQFLDRLSQTNRRLPDQAQRHLPEVPTTPDFFYEPNVGLYCDGRVHDEPQQRALDERLRRELKAHGYRVLVLRYDADLGAWMQGYPEVLREA